ncbi:unnamed protein product [Pedinophyceae sp. YPF-701]|nr:unnamed protein product [Pedinophyceae sp. YPF-701]
MSVTWKAALNAALRKNKRHMPYAKYVQVATVRADGRGAANRTVVYRGWLDQSDACSTLTFVTDSRSAKVADVAAQPLGEVAWYLPGTREQFRIHGKLTIVGGGEAPEELAKARVRAWKALSDGARKQFCWPHPGLPRESAATDPFDDPPNVPAQDEEPAEMFCLMTLEPEVVDHLSLRSNERYLHSLKDGVWDKAFVNP